MDIEVNGIREKHSPVGHKPHFVSGLLSFSNSNPKARGGGGSYYIP